MSSTALAAGTVLLSMVLFADLPIVPLEVL